MLMKWIDRNKNGGWTKYRKLDWNEDLNRKTYASLKIRRDSDIRSKTKLCNRMRETRKHIQTCTKPTHF